MQCQPGEYCERGSVTPKKCPAGTYNPEVQSVDISECLECPEGRYCTEGQGSAASDLPRCDDGWFCIGGSSNSTQNECLPGSKCVNGTIQACDTGTYQENRRRTDCDPCLAGDYCPLIGMNQPFGCPEGFYCLGGASATVNSNA